MPTKALSKNIVKRLRKATPKIDANFHRLPNRDHRTPNDNPRLRKKTSYDPPGFRVRGVTFFSRFKDGSRNYSQYKIVIKRTHYHSAREEINEIRNRVRIVNKQNHSQFIVLMPKAHAISNGLIAMKEVNFPSVVEMFQGNAITLRAKLMVDRLNKLGINSEKLFNAAQDAARSLGMDKSNLMVLGAKNGKVVFMPLIDLL